MQKARNLRRIMRLRVYFFNIISRKRLTIHRKRCIIYSGGERYDRYRKCPSRHGKCDNNLGRINHNSQNLERQVTSKGVERKLYSSYTYHSTMNKKILQLLVAILAVLSWIRVCFSQDALSITASVIITIALICVVLKKR